MSVDNEVRAVNYTGDSVVTVWAYNFLIPTDTEVVVEVYNSVTNTYTVINAANFSITGVGNPSGGTITYPTSGSPLTANDTIFISRVVGYTQDLDIPQTGEFDSSTLEQQLDDIVFQIQQTRDEGAGAIRLPPGESFQVLPPKATLAGKAIIFDETTSEPRGGPNAADIENAGTNATAAAASAVAAGNAQTAAEAAQAAAEQIAANIGVTLFVSDTRPSAPETGVAWFDTRSLQMFIWYEDGDSSQWIEQPCAIMVPQAAGPSSGVASVNGDVGPAVVLDSDDITEGSVNLYMSGAEQTKLAGIEDNATADQTGAQIKAAYEGETNTNAFTDAEQTKLSGVEANATAAGLYSTSDAVLTTVDVADRVSFVDVSDTNTPKLATKTNFLKELQAEVTALNGGGVTTITTISQVAYDALAPADANTLYLITS